MPIVCQCAVLEVLYYCIFDLFLGLLGLCCHVLIFPMTVVFAQFGTLAQTFSF